jgi:hypothetical protein
MEGRTGPTASEVKGWGIDGEVTAVFPSRGLASQIPPAPAPPPQQLRSAFHTSVFPGFRFTSLASSSSPVSHATTRPPFLHENFTTAS